MRHGLIVFGSGLALGALVIFGLMYNQTIMNRLAMIDAKLAYEKIKQSQFEMQQQLHVCVELPTLEKFLQYKAYEAWLAPDIGITMQRILPTNEDAVRYDLDNTGLDADRIGEQR